MKQVPMSSKHVDGKYNPPAFFWQQAVLNLNFHVMFIIIGIMFTGVAIGYLFKNLSFLRNTEKTISYTIILLLFILGLSIGSNKLIIDNLAAFGWQAAVIALSATCGSILASWMTLKLFFKKGGKR